MYKEAEETMREAMSIMPDNSQFYYSLGVLFGKTKRLEVSPSKSLSQYYSIPVL